MIEAQLIADAIHYVGNNVFWGFVIAAIIRAVFNK